MLEKLLGSKLRARVLEWLFSHPGERFYVRQLESILGQDSTNLARELGRLADMGLLTREVEGRQKYYSASSRSPVFEELRGLVRKTSGVANVLRDCLKPLAGKIDAAFIHGSVARGEESRESDVDLMVIGAVRFAEVTAAVRPSQKTLGREVNPTVYPLSEWRRKVAERHHFLHSVLAGKKIFLIGDARELGRLAQERMAEKT